MVGQWHIPRGGGCYDNKRAGYDSHSHRKKRGFLFSRNRPGMGVETRKALSNWRTPMSRVSSAHAFIMVIDNSLTIRKILQILLSRQGYQGITFTDGSPALRWLRGSASHVPDLIFLDLSLPSMNGYQVARAVRSLPHCKHLPIVLFIRHDRGIERILARLVGINCILTKPFTTRHIISIVQKYLKGSLRYERT